MPKRFIPPHAEAGSVEAQIWAEKMRLAKEKKKRVAFQIRQAGLKTEEEFFGESGPLRKHKLNPGKKWHDGMAQVAGRYRKEAITQTEKHIYAGMEQAHKDSASAAQKLGMNPSSLSKAERKVLEKFGIIKKQPKVKKNPIAVFNPPAEVAGTIYNNAIEIKAQKTGSSLKGHYKHVFGKNVRILGLKDGTVLLQHKDGKPLWITRKEYDERGGKHE